MHTQNVVCSLALVYGRSLQPHKKITKERGCVLELPFAKQSSPWFIMIELPTESLLHKDLCTSAIFLKEKKGQLRHFVPLLGSENQWPVDESFVRDGATVIKDAAGSVTS